ncbi:MAG: AMP-binding protein, partial [Solirubrobacterales bacterium]
MEAVREAFAPGECNLMTLVVAAETPAADASADHAHAGFLLSEGRFSDRPALEVGGETLTYRDLGLRSRAIAATIARERPSGDSQITAIFASRSTTAFAAVLATVLDGRGYVALSRRFPIERTRLMLAAADARVVIVDGDSAEQLADLAAEIRHRLLLVLPDLDDVTELARRLPQHTVLGSGDLEDGRDWAPPAVDPEAVAYLIFTSGSTGSPKAVEVPHRTLRRYVEIAADQWEVTENDRCSQMYDLTFDASVSDMFVAWERGACVCCPSAQQLVVPQKFIQSARLTFFDSVPSTGLIMKKLGLLKPGAYPLLRTVLISGEALPAELAAAWAAAAPNSVVENVYGPTEVTIGCSRYRWDAERSPNECEQGIVPIGSFHPGTEALVLDADGREVAEGGE